MERAHVTNETVAQELGITHSAVSRIRSGDRLPSLALVRRIAATYGWSIEDQIASRDPMVYANGFEDLLRQRYA